MSMFRRASGRIAGARLAIGLSACAVALAAPPGAFAHDVKVGSIGIEHPWSRATPPGATTGAGYLELRNEGSEADRLVGASSPAVPRVEIHEMKVENGIMHMAPVAGGLLIPAGAQVALKPGGYHLMLMNLRKPLKAGERVPVTLRFERAGPVDVTLDVGKIGAGGPDVAQAAASHGRDMEGAMR